MKAVLLSTRPKWCELIASWQKRAEIRKTKPKLETPFKCYIYCTQDTRLLRKFNKGERIDDEHFFEEHVFVRQNTWIRGHFNSNGKVIGEFVCDRIDYWNRHIHDDDTITLEMASELSCVSEDELLKYADLGHFYAWHISDLVIYEKPRPLSDFRKSGFDRVILLKRPPQSWCYVEEE